MALGCAIGEAETSPVGATSRSEKVDESFMVKYSERVRLWQFYGKEPSEEWNPRSNREFLIFFI
jgi:hypothetical protein